MFIHESGPKDGKVVLFLHGNGASGAMWHNHFEFLKEYHCLAPDFPGYGKSNKEEWVSLDKTADEIIEYLEENNYKNVNMVGLSLGSSVAFTLLGKKPELFDHVVIDGAGVLGMPGLPFMKVAFLLMQPFLHTEFLIKTIANMTKITGDDYPEFRETMIQMSPSSFRRSFIQALSLKQPKGLEKYPNPVLFVCGEKEPESVRESNRMLGNLMPKADSRIAPSMGHGWLAEKPKLHCEMVKNWLEGKPVPSELTLNIKEEHE